jgi:predicted RNA-binding Zn-ribbon protein involved in translation (DUF1610 family)
MTKKENFSRQIALQNKAISAGVNIVSCGRCGDVLLADAKAKKIQCPHCDAIMEACDFSDLFYTGMEIHD